jgi:molybdate transport system ATP-binding protein
MIKLAIKKTLAAPSGPMILDVDQEISECSLITIYGKSGAGKTSLLRVLAGLMDPDDGYISFGEDIWLDKKRRINLRPQKRHIGFVFQDYALFPNMTVRQNLQFAVGKGNSAHIVDELIDIMELRGLQHYLPLNLSGGQKQRVALARSLVQRPKCLLLDEPLAALDLEMRMKLQEYLLQVHIQYNLTTILVSHDPSEIIKLSDQIWVMDEGKIIKTGPPSEIFGSSSLSGNFNLTGEIVDISRENFLCVLTILIGKDLVKVISDESEVVNLSKGDKVQVIAKAFNPMIRKI